MRTTQAVGMPVLHCGDRQPNGKAKRASHSCAQPPVALAFGHGCTFAGCSADWAVTSSRTSLPRTRLASVTFSARGSGAWRIAAFVDYASPARSPESCLVVAGDIGGDGAACSEDFSGSSLVVPSSAVCSVHRLPSQ